MIDLLNTVGGVLGNLLSFVVGLAGPMLVQGALVEIVRNFHEGRRPAGIVELVRRAGRRIVPLVCASLLYVVAIVVGVFLLIVPGLYVAGRWSLLEPAIMLENRRLFDALDRSRRIVRGEENLGLGDRTWTALGVVIVTYVITGAVPTFVLVVAFGLHSSFPDVVAQTAIYSLTAPYAAHVLSVLYYRFVDPRSPTIHPDVQGWRSVWEGPT